MDLLKDTNFSTYLHEMCHKNKVKKINVQRCIANLYHSVSKSYHGNMPNVVLFQNDWVKNDLFALGCIFFYFNVKFYYKDQNGKDPDFPFKFEEKYIMRKIPEKSGEEKHQSD